MADLDPSLQSKIESLQTSHTSLIDAVRGYKGGTVAGSTAALESAQRAAANIVSLASSVATELGDLSATVTDVQTASNAAQTARNEAEAARDSAMQIADPDQAMNAAFDILIKDVERAQFEAATGGQCTIERTPNGQSSYMFVLPKTTWDDLVPSGELGTGVHEAFIVDGVEKSELLYGMYPASSVNGELVSQPFQKPKTYIDWDDSRSQAQAAGFDISGNWEWSAIAFWCMANGFQPRGNTDSGKSHSHPHEQGVNVQYDNTRTGSGPNAWSHNAAANGIADLVGNVWEWQWGFKLVDGRVFLAPDNDKSLAESSWVDTGWDMPASGTFASQYDELAPESVQRALIMPNGVADPDGRLYTNLEGERFPTRGGTRSYGGGAGLGALYLNSSRTTSYSFRGLRLSRLV